jgi:hypothetical protein
VQSKGAAIALVAVIMGVFIASGAIFSSLFTEQRITATANYSTGHVHTTLEAQTRRDIYEKNIQKELKYAYNNIAYNKEEVEWTNKPPSDSELKTRFKQDLLKSRYGLKDQNRVFHCEAPGINMGNTQVTPDNNLKLDMSGKYVECRGKDSKVFMPVKDEITSSNNNNNYLEMLKYSQRLAEEAENRLSSAESVEIDYEGSCTQESSIDTSEAEESALSEAKKDSVTEGNRYAEAVYEATSSDRPSFIEAEEISGGLEGSSTIDIDSENCGSNKVKYTGTVEFTPEEANVEYSLKDQDNQVLTYDGMATISFDFVYTSRTG